MTNSNMSQKTGKTPVLRIQKDVLEKAKKSKGLIGRLIIETGKSYPTVMRWFDINSEMLTTASSLKVFCEELNLTQSEILTH
jgi:hypothetical protein